MGGATRFMTLLTTPFPPLRPSLNLLHRRLSSLSSAPLRSLTLFSPSRTKPPTPQLVNSFHSQPTNNNYTLQSSTAQHPQQQHHHPWPEWNHFLNILSNGQGFSVHQDHRIPPEDAFVVYEELPDDFVRASAACLAFARARPDILGLLSRRDIEAVVSNGTPFLFKSALDTARRMRAFLGTDGTVASEVDKANTTDLMKYILSYASNATGTSERNGLYSREFVDSSVRNLLHELGTISSGVPTSHMPASGHPLSGGYRQTPKPFGQNIEMKRGDWICPKCNFMNFARNMKCLECEESRPKKQLTGGEWECPQCNFFNYGRNSVCLRCDCRRPGAPLFNTTPVSRHNGDNSNIINMDKRAAGNEEKAQSWFNKISQLSKANDIITAASNKDVPEMNSSTEGENITFPKDSENEIDIQNKEKEQAEKSERWFKKMAELHDVKDLPSAVSDEDFPEIMPMRKGENRFVVSKKKDRSLTSPKYKRQVAMDQANNTNFVPFVPFPPGYFAKKDPEQPSSSNSPVKSESENKTMAETEKSDDFRYGTADSRVKSESENKTMANIEKSSDFRYGTADANILPGRDDKPMSSENSSFSSETMAETSNVPRIGKNETVGSYDAQTQTSQHGYDTARTQDTTVRSSWTGKSLEGSAVKEPDPLDMSEEAKAERWFKRVAQIKDISELSQIPDEDFPSIMPMRKGVNRFVVSKRKTPLERRLTSQQYRRNLPVVSNEPVKKESDSS